jgi:apolipoprotein D and lipocalin family protein
MTARARRLRHPGLRRPALCLAISAAVLASGCAAGDRQAAGAAGGAPPLPALDVASYLGTWHQVAHYPNRFQRQCVADTTAEYRQAAGDRLEVRNRCRTATGHDQVIGEARPRGSTIRDGRLMPASLEVSFLPPWIRWLPVGWGSYDVVRLADDGSVAIVSEPTRRYLWVLSRSPHIDTATWNGIAQWLDGNGFDLTRVVRSPDR